jgi:hypothetical protein
MAGSLNENAGLKFELAIPNALKGLWQIRGRDSGEETEAADVNAQNGSARAGDFAGDTEHGAVPAKYHQQVHLARQGGRVGANHSL